MVTDRCLLVSSIDWIYINAKLLRPPLTPNCSGRVNIIGKVRLMPQEEKEEAKTLYLEKHPGAFWVSS